MDVRHDLSGVLFIAFAAMLCGAELRQYGSVPRRRDAFCRGFVGRLVTPGQIVALDGKSLCGAVDPAKPMQPLHWSLPGRSGSDSYSGSSARPGALRRQQLTR